MQATIVTGIRHTHHERGCFCGCAAVEGATGYVVQDSDTPKLATLGMLVAEFPEVPYHQGPVRIAYDYAELGLPVPTFEPERRHESARLFEPAPAVMPGQLGFGVSRENPGT